jgi:serine/threonine-protein kinase HipA
MQLKFSAHRRDRISLPAHGELSEWILKLPPSDLPRLPTWEAAALSWARAVGFDVPEHAVEPLTRVDGLPDDVRASGGTCLVVRRFDRPGGDRRVHMEEVCSILGLHPEAKYADSGQGYNLITVGRVVRRFAGPDDAITFVERIVFDALVGNGDAHLRNWALTFPDGHAGRLAPVYDVVPTALLLHDPGLALPLHGSRAPTFEQVHPHAVRTLAQRIDLDPDRAGSRARDLVHRGLATFDEAVAPWGLSADERERWRAHIERVAGEWR